MLDTATSLLRSATLPRALLLLNHVVASEPAAVERLKPRAGSVLSIELDGLPGPLAFLSPAAAPLALQITPAGLFEAVDAGPDAAGGLRIRLDASNPLRTAVQAAAGQRPDVRIDGDAGLAADISWLFDNLRWDAEDDLAKVVGPGAAHELARIGRAVSAAVRTLAGGVAGVVSSVAGSRGPGAR
jgi:ubiquinone biosynthesis protein UbiJ